MRNETKETRSERRQFKLNFHDSVKAVVDDKRYRLTQIGMDILELKFALASKHRDKNIVYTSLPTRAAAIVRDNLQQQGFEASVHYAGKSNRYMSELVIYLDDVKSVLR